MQFRLQNENICSKTFQLPSQLSKQKRSTLQSTKTSENFESGTNGKGASWESLFRKSESCQISEKRTIQPKLLEIPEGKIKWHGNLLVRNFRKNRNFCIPRKVVFFYENSVKCYVIRHCKFPIMQFSWSNEKHLKFVAV